MKEDYLHYIWQFGLFDLSDLKTTQGEPILILSKGIHNTNAGPDFLNARIKIGDTVWAGNVELHIKSSDWLKHGHQNDAAYNNVILHVVLLDDRDLEKDTHLKLSTLSLSKRIDIDHYNRYQNLISNNAKIPCENQLDHVEDFIVQSTLERLGVNRLERKTLRIIEDLEASRNNWSQVYFQLLARNFGMKVNAIPFELLAKSLDIKILFKHIDNPIQIEAFLFGQSGLLDQAFEDEYPNQLKKEYDFLRTKYNLKAINKTTWKFMRMRPSNFPTVRIAQLASFITKNKGLSDLDFQHFELKYLQNAFNIDVNPYWNNRYRFDNSTIIKSKRIGKLTFHNIIINTIVPILFAYATVNKDQRIKDMALDILSEVPSEKNGIIDHWKKIGVEAGNAFDSQALLELRNEHCIRKKCLTCNIGVNLLKDVVLND